MKYDSKYLCDALRIDPSKAEEIHDLANGMSSFRRFKARRMLICSKEASLSPRRDEKGPILPDGPFRLHS